MSDWNFNTSETVIGSITVIISIVALIVAILGYRNEKKGKEEAIEDNHIIKNDFIKKEFEFNNSQEKIKNNEKEHKIEIKQSHHKSERLIIDQLYLISELKNFNYEKEEKNNKHIYDFIWYRNGQREIFEIKSGNIRTQVINNVIHHFKNIDSTSYLIYDANINILTDNQNRRLFENNIISIPMSEILTYFKIK